VLPAAGYDYDIDWTCFGGTERRAGQQAERPALVEPKNESVATIADSSDEKTLTP
jgi:hypothetical protein